MRSHEIPALFCWMAGISGICAAQTSQQPPEPVDIAPINGQVYYLLNQLSGLNADLNNNSTLAGDRIVQQQPSFTSLSQRWTLTQVADGVWQIGNTGNGLCLASAGSARLCMPRNWGAREGAAAVRRSYTASCPIVQDPCTSTAVQQWSPIATSNGYYMIVNKSTGLLIGLSQGATSAGAALAESELLGGATQSQQWLLRPAFLRGIDNALLEKQEAARAAAGLPWWNDAGQQEDVLQMFRNHGINMVRLRPSSVPPYANVSQTGCSGNACYGETDAQDLDLAKRAKNLGMSIEMTLLFDGGSSSSVPPGWANNTQLSALQSDLYNYVKAEILSYRQAGTMPDLVSIGNEVDTGFLGAIGSPTGQDLGGFAALQTTAMQAIRDAAADASIGPAIPAPLTCIHITPAWDLTQFFTLANEFKIPYDAICQSYYPIYHGPLTDAQAAASNPGGKPVEQDVLVNAANNIGKPIFIIETGEHYENGFDSNDPWYAPPSPALQSQFLQDLSGVVTGLPNNLGMGIEYWDPTGVDIHNAAGQLINGDNLPNAIYIWTGLTLFTDVDASLLPGAEALGGGTQAGLVLKKTQNSGTKR